LAFLVNNVSVGSGCCATNAYVEAPWSADQPGYQPPAFYDLVSISATTPVSVQGLDLSAGRSVQFLNTSSVPITFVPSSASASASSMQLDLPGQAPLTLGYGDTATFYNDGSLVRLLDTTATPATSSGAGASDFVARGTRGGALTELGRLLSSGGLELPRAAAAPPALPAGYGEFYFDVATGRPMAKDDAGNVYDLSSTSFTEAPVTAAGTTQGTAAPLTARTSKVTGANGTAGVILPANPGWYGVWNAAAAVLKVYPPTGSQISTIGVNAPYNHSNNTFVVYYRAAAGQWFYTGNMI
jgi:hypothetical protein